jgi:hypothetical protein
MNEKDSYQIDFENSIKTLEDIQYLSEFSISPLIGRAYFHLSEMKRKADALKLGQVSGFGSVAKVLDEKLEDIFVEYFSNKNRFKEYDYKKETAKIDLQKWNQILEIVPEVLSVVSLFQYHGKVETILNENRLHISGHIRQDSSLEMNRKFIYVVTRKLLRRQVLLTFNLEESGRQGVFKLDLKVDISHDNSLVYRVMFKPNQNQQVYIGFSNIFCQYRKNVDDVKMIGEHNVVEVLNDLSVRHSYSIPDLSRIESANKEILHFPFLFRPVSIILPMKGNLSSDSFSRSLDSSSMNGTNRESKNEDQKRKQDVSISYHNIDFFSLFNL